MQTHLDMRRYPGALWWLPSPEAGLCGLWNGWNCRGLLNMRRRKEALPTVRKRACQRPLPNKWRVSTGKSKDCAWCRGRKLALSSQKELTLLLLGRIIYFTLFLPPAGTWHICSATRNSSKCRPPLVLLITKQLPRWGHWLNTWAKVADSFRTRQCWLCSYCRFPDH